MPLTLHNRWDVLFVGRLRMPRRVGDVSPVLLGTDAWKFKVDHDADVRTT